MIVFIIGLRRAINILRLYRITEAFHFIVMGNEFLGESVSFSTLAMFTYIVTIRLLGKYCYISILGNYIYC